LEQRGEGIGTRVDLEARTPTTTKVPSWWLVTIPLIHRYQYGAIAICFSASKSQNRRGTIEPKPWKREDHFLIPTLRVNVSQHLRS
jgi:hypothetical protein